MKTLYKKVIIRSEDDLPKEDGEYIVSRKGIHTKGFVEEAIFKKESILESFLPDFWIDNYDWYLLPTEIKFPSEVSPRVAKLIIQIRDLFIDAKDTPLDTMDEIWHLLYQIASPNYDKLCEDVWMD